MRTVSINRPAIRIRVLKNGKNADWLKIVNADNGEILHIGKPRYIRRVAKNRYNSIIGL